MRHILTHTWCRPKIKSVRRYLDMGIGEWRKWFVSLLWGDGLENISWLYPPPTYHSYLERFSNVVITFCRLGYGPGLGSGEEKSYERNPDGYPTSSTHVSQGGTLPPPSLLPPLFIHCWQTYGHPVFSAPLPLLPSCLVKGCEFPVTGSWGI